MNYVRKPVFTSLLAALVLMMTTATVIAGQAKVVILDECDPNTFNPLFGNPALGNIACINVGGAETFATFATFLPTGDPLWAFSPVQLNINQGDTVVVSSEGGENHTFTPVTQFGNGFIPGLNNPTGSTNTIPECQGGFTNNDVAATRVVPRSSTVITGLKPGKHLYECCFHPWMRMEIDVGQNSQGN
jgi:plastocyanin